MTFKYYESGSPTYFENPKTKWISGYDAFVNQQFQHASDYYIIQEESSFASGSLVDVGVRIKRAVDSTTGQKLGDDYKTIVFQDNIHSTGIGYKYYFDENYWIATHSEALKGITTSVTAKRCNSVLRWVDENGNEFSEPCSIDYDINRATDHSLGKNPNLPEGFLRLYSQLNDGSKRIKEGQRFLFGTSVNRVCYYVYGGGKRNYLNQQTEDDESGNLLQLILGVHQINPETDDIINGIADKYKVSYGITTIPTSIEANVGETMQITPAITRNNIVVDRDVSYSTSASSVADVSVDGVVSMISTGSCVITVAMSDNSLISGSVATVVSGSPVSNSEIRISPSPDFILQGDTETYNVTLYLDGILQGDSFVFAIENDNVPAENYVFTTVDGNNFSISNEELYMADTLDISCVSGSYSRDISILLKGSW